MIIDLDLGGQVAKFVRPEILQHPQIPGPMSGMNPRTLLGREWWNATRKEAYKANNYHCYACGTSTDDDPIRPRLDAHECFDIDWETASARYVETVALCYSCHNFIHAGRLHFLVQEGRKKLKELIGILKRGYEILQSQDPPLYPFWRTYTLYLEYVERAVPRIAVGRARDLGIVPLGSTFYLPDHYWSVEILGKTYRRNQNGTITITS